MKLMIVFYIIFLIFLAALIVVALTSSKILKNKKDAIIIYSIGTIIYGVLFILTLRLQLDSYNYVYVEPASKSPINNKMDISNNDNTDNKKDVLKKNLEEILKEYKVKDITIVTLIEGGYEANIQIELDPQMPHNKENVKNKFNDIEGKVKPIINKYKIELVNNKSQLVMLGSDKGESHWEDIISENNIKDNPEDLKKHLYADSKGNGLIKGNTNKRTGEKIYHIPGSTYYNRTKIEDTEKWFKTIEEAEEAGYRAPKR